MPDTIADALGQLEQDYIKRTPKSQAAIRDACEVMPGGDTRCVLNFPPHPIVVASGEGSVITDVDGNEYRDFLNDFSAGLYGHSNERIQAAIRQAISEGLTLGGINRYESQFARVLVERFPALELVRFTNSGTEANMMAIATARKATGQDKILVMRGGYHGNSIYLSELASRTNAPYDFVIGTFNDLEGTEAAIGKNRKKLAAILVEPMMGASGCIPGNPEFLRGLRQIADETGAVLIFDEVMTSRLGSTGAHGLFDVAPDMMTCGKFLGGGGTFGAFGGSARLMGMLDVRGTNPILHGGTFNNNVITMAAGLTGLRDIYTPQVASEFYSTGNQFREDLNAIAKEQQVKAQMTGMGSLLSFHCHGRPVRTLAEAGGVSSKVTDLLHMALLHRGIYIARRGYASLSLVNDESDRDAFKEAFADVLATYRDLFNEVAQAAEQALH